MALQRYRVMISTTTTRNVNVTLDDSLIPDDEWRSQFYGSIRTLQDVAEMFGRGYLRYDLRPERLDGFYGVEAAKDVVLERGLPDDDEYEEVFSYRLDEID